MIVLWLIDGYSMHAVKNFFYRRLLRAAEKVKHERHGIKGGKTAFPSFFAGLGEKRSLTDREFFCEKFIFKSGPELSDREHCRFPLPRIRIKC